MLLALSLAFAGEPTPTTSPVDELEAHAREAYPSYFTCKEEARLNFESKPLTLDGITIAHGAMEDCGYQARLDHAEYTRRMSELRPSLSKANTDWETAQTNYAEKMRASTAPSTEDIKDDWVRAQVDRVAGQIDQDTQEYLDARTKVTDLRTKMDTLSRAATVANWVIEDRQDELTRYDKIRDGAVKAYCADRRIEIGAPPGICDVYRTVDTRPWHQ